MRNVCSVFVLAALAMAAHPSQAAEKPRMAPLEVEKPASADPWKRYGRWPQTDWKEFNTLRTKVAPPVKGLQKVFGPIEDASPENGRKLALDRSRGGGCAACHVLPDIALPGNIGPDLSTIGTWGRSDWYLYNYIYDPRVFNPGSMMPPWGNHGLYTESEIRDIVAYLKTLKTPTTFKDPNENPAQRPLPKATADYLDPTENPAMFELDSGKALFNKAGPGGKSCANCHAKPEREFKNWASTMPKYEPRMKKVLNTEEFITRHARATTGHDLQMQSKENDALSIYVRHFAHGRPINVQFRTKQEKAAAKRGQDLMKHKIGQLNFACTDCHVLGANRWVRGQYLTVSKGQVGRHPYWRTSQGEIWTLRKRFQWCGVAIRANELLPDAPEYADLEYYLTSLSNGKKIDGPGIGH